MATAESEPRLTPDDEALTLAEVAGLLRSSEEDVAALTEAGALPARRIGREWRFSRQAVGTWLAFPDGSLNQRLRVEVLVLRKEMTALTTRIRELEEQVGGAAPPKSDAPNRTTRKEQILSFAGKWRDDAEVAEVFSDIERARKRSAEDES